MITFSHVGTPGGVVKEHPVAVQDNGGGGGIVSNTFLPGSPRQNASRTVCLPNFTSQESIDRTTTLCKSRH